MGTNQYLLLYNIDMSNWDMNVKKNDPKTI